MQTSVQPFKFEDDRFYVLDQKNLPFDITYFEIKNIKDGYRAINEMMVRGAPLIGFTAIYTMAVWCKNKGDKTLNQAIDYLASARPTAVNLQFELNEVQSILEQLNTHDSQYSTGYSILKEHGDKKLKNANLSHLAMAKNLVQDLDKRTKKKNLNILTHCNTGVLACGSMGTALGVISYLHGLDRIANVWVDETRPYLQGSRLTAFELGYENIPHQIVVEGSANHLMEAHQVDAIFVGADRIAANGDTANKIGTANLSIIARYYDIPFYVVAPVSTFDMSLSSGDLIEIELREAREITHFRSHAISPVNSKVYNPSFDITRAKNITGISCENGMITPVTPSHMERIFNGS